MNPLNFIIGLEVVWGVLILLNWHKMFTTEHDWSNHPEGFWIHERAFVWPDVVIAILMITSALYLYMGNQAGEKLALIAAGMTLFLGIIDVAYEYQNEFYKAPRGNMGHFIGTNLFIVIALVIIIYFF